ncbi:DUF2802 domain-containing protein [Aliagarivorans marinus]|uniref:DUF2802 domain-containing protein n=1 Tax=Aliagarivorans marinus TaxID=561965 RepID=UPI0003FA9305|nr:DUF2802 domain-containing protein [Aliagarivorans marinus]
MNGILISLLVLLPCCILVFAWLAKRLHAKLEEAQRKVKSLERLAKELLSKQVATEKQLSELHAANSAFTGELARQREALEETERKQGQLQSMAQDTDSKLYNRAMKMVELGADVTEVMRECEIPKAEAELLLNLQQKLKGSA